MPSMKVEAIETGYYGDVRRKPGHKKFGTFVLTSPTHFSKKWMKDLSEGEIERQLKALKGKEIQAKGVNPYADEDPIEAAPPAQKKAPKPAQKKGKPSPVAAEE